MNDITPIPDRAAYLKAIRPAVRGQSDKYSWLLFRHLSRHNLAVELRVLAHQLDLADNATFRPFDKATAQSAQLFIGYLDDGWGCGAYLSDIINPTNRRWPGIGTAWPPRVLVHAVDVSDWFWPEYARIGRCVWDPGHNGFMVGTEGRFIIEAGKRTRLCNWCGQRQRLVTKRKTVRVHAWVSEEAA